MGIELGNSLDRHQVLDAVLQCGPRLVNTREYRRDIVDDCCPLRGVIDFEIADNINQHLELIGTAADLFLQDSAFSHRFQVGNLSVLVADLFFVGGERLVSQQEFDAAKGEPFGRLGDTIL